MPAWTPERIAALPIEGVKTLRENALRHRNNDVVALCDADLARRFPVRDRMLRVGLSPECRKNQVVIGFHFVCPRETGVSINGDGTVWTGTWVVDKVHAEHGTRIGAYVALHAAKSELSYLQGVIKDWRRSPRQREYAEGRKVKTEFGIDFLLQLTNAPYQWSGDGAGEKGYAWGTPDQLVSSRPDSAA